MSMVNAIAWEVGCCGDKVELIHQKTHNRTWGLATFKCPTCSKEWKAEMFWRPLQERNTRRAIQPDRDCRVDQCFNGLKALGLCELHYNRLKSSGDPELTRKRGPQKRQA